MGVKQQAISTLFQAALAAVKSINIAEYYNSLLPIILTEAYILMMGILPRLNPLFSVQRRTMFDCYVRWSDIVDKIKGCITLGYS